MKDDSLAHIPFLDGVRATAALMVMVFHFVGHHGEPAAIKQMAVIGQTGVELFFVLSGFLITRILLAAKGSTNFFSAFYVRRILRIFPLYYGFLVLYFFIFPILSGSEIPPFNTQVWAWSYLQNIPLTFPGIPDSGPGHFWSLAIEEHFYLLWPLLISVTSRRQLWVLLGFALVVPAILRFIFLQHGIDVFYFTFTRLDSLAYGALLALISVSGFRVAVLRRLFRGLLLGLVILLIPSFVILSGRGFDWMQVVKLSLIPAGYFALLGFCIFDPLSAPLVRLFSTRALRAIGSISYGLYVFHVSCFALIYKLLSPTSFLAELFASFSLTFAVAFLSYRYYERPILALNRFFKYRKGIGEAPRVDARVA